MPDPIPTLTYYAAHPCNNMADCKLEEPSIMRKARRSKGSIYKQLLLELYQDGCYSAARHFEYLVEEEQALIAKEYERFYVYQKPDFLLKIIENVKAAEQIYRLDKKNGVYMSRRLLNELVALVEKERFEWLTVKLYQIICEYMLQTTSSDILAREQSARFIFTYSRFLMQRGGYESLRQATIILPIAMEVACSEPWKPNTSPEIEKFPTLHVALCSLLTEIYLVKAKQPGITSKRAMKRVQKGLKAIAEVGPMHNKALSFKALLFKVDVLIQADRCDWALKELKLFEKSLLEMLDAEYLPYQLDLLLKLGICMYNLNEPRKAIHVFAKALTMCKRHNYIEAEGEILLHIGQTQKRIPHGQLKARLAFQLAKTHFQLSGEHEKEQKIRYMIASLKSDLIKPNLYKLMNSNKYCDFYKLRQWKNVCEPFWEDDNKHGHLTRQTLNSISMFSIHNLHKLYHLVLNTQAAFNVVQEAEEEESEDQSTNDSDRDLDFLERIIASNIYVDDDNYDYDVEEESVEEEDDAEGRSVYSYVPTHDTIIKSDVSQMLEYIETISPRRRHSSIASGTKSRRSTLKSNWMPSETDSIICLLRQEDYS